MWFLTILAIVASVLVNSNGFTIRPRGDDGRIVGGEDADIAKYPYQLSLQRSGRHICGASIIGAKVALTAAHCTHKVFSTLQVRSGSNYTTSGGVLVQVAIIKQHPRYNPVTIDFDVSVLKFSKIFTAPAIPLQPKGTEVPVGALGTVTGWGAKSENGNSSAQLQKVEVAHISDAECNLNYAVGITPRMTCYASPGKDSCQGDSGGPLVVASKQVGIVSWGYGCAQPEYPGVYTKISDNYISIHILLNIQ